MNSNDSFRRKIIYICMIAVLLIILPIISLPATVKKGAGESSGGGVIAQMRKTHQLSQAEISEIDPASESMKLATLGLRPVAVTLLWNQVQDAKKKHQWDRLRTATQTLIALQPNFIRVWEYQAHNLSYNISREFDDFQYRYHWVKEGLSYLMTGIAYNRKDHRIFDNLGFFFGLKLGRSDERLQFRRLFRRDADYHDKMAEYGIDKTKINSPELGGPDNWLAAYEWYDRSRYSVDNRNLPRRTSGLMFYKNCPSSLRNYAIDYEKDKRPDEAAQLAWTKAFDEWTGDDDSFGKRTILTSTGLPIYLDRIAEAQERMRELRAELDKVAPGIREELQKAREAQMNDDLWEAYNTPYEELKDREQEALQMQAKSIMDVDKDRLFRDEVARRLATGELKFTSEQQLVHDRVIAEMGEILRTQSFSNKYRGTVNYTYWRDRCESESLDITIEARKALFDARELSKLAKIDEQDVRVEKKDQNGNYILDKNGQRVVETIKEPGAIQKYLESFKLWKQILEDYEGLADDVMEDDLLDAMKEYYSSLRKVRQEWPLDFPLQELIDRRERRRINDGLPTSTSPELADRLEEAREKEEANKQEKENQNDPVNQADPKTPAKSDPDKKGKEPSKKQPEKSAKPSDNKQADPDNGKEPADPKKSAAPKKAAEPKKSAEPKKADESKKGDGTAKPDASQSSPVPKKAEPAKKAEPKTDGKAETVK